MPKSDFDLKEYFANCLCLLLVILIGESLRVDALCSSVEYSNQIRDVLSNQDDFDIFEGVLIFLENKTYPQKNPYLQNTREFRAQKRETKTKTKK